MREIVLPGRKRPTESTWGSSRGGHKPAYEDLQRDKVTGILAAALPVEEILVHDGYFIFQSMLFDPFPLSRRERFRDFDNGVSRAFVHFGMSIPKVSHDIDHERTITSPDFVEYEVVVWPVMKFVMSQKRFGDDPRVMGLRAMNACETTSARAASGCARSPLD